MNHAAIIVAGSALLGAAWRRWEGQEMTGFLAHRWLKLTVAAVFGFGVCWYWTGNPLAAALVSAILTAGWTDGAQFGSLETAVPWQLIPRYGVVTLLAAIAAALVMRDGRALLYAPIGCLAPIGYMAGKRIASCWTCVGECWLGFIMYGGLALLAL